MQLHHDGNFHVPVHPEVPRDVHQAVLEQIFADRQTEVARLGTQADEMVAIGQLHRHRLQEAIGADTYERLRTTREDDRRARRPAPPVREIGPEGLDGIRQERRKRSRQLLESLAIDPGTVRETHKETLALLERLAGQGGDGRTGTLVRSDQVVEPPGELTAGWTVQTPPYAGWDWWREWNTRGFSAGVGHYIDPGQGIASATNQLVDQDAGDHDQGFQSYGTAVGFWYLMPAAGQVETYILGRSSAGHHHLSLHDEFGLSAAAAYQNTYLTLQVTAPQVSDMRVAETSSFASREPTDGTWDWHPYGQGEEFLAHLGTAMAYPANTWVYVQAGNLTVNHCFADDVAVYSTVDFSWSLPEVRVRSTGG